MDELEPGHTTAPFTPQRAGETLRTAREALGLSLADVSARTRVPLRHLEAIEVADYSSLPSHTYAVGFAKAYARVVGVDEVGIAAKVRAEVDQLGRPAPAYQPYEAADPTRVPSRGVAVVALGVALAILVLVGLWYGTDLFQGGAGGSTPPLTTQAIVAAPGTAGSQPMTAASPVPRSATGGQVTLTASDEVWLRVYDANNTTLYLGTLKPGEKFDVPQAANNPMINVGRADKLQVTLNGSAVAPLGTGEHAIKDVPVSGAAIAARANGTPLPVASATPVAMTTGRVPTVQSGSPRPRRVLTETQRANLASAAKLRAGGNAD